MNLKAGIVLLCLGMTLWATPGWPVMPPPGAITPPAGEKEAPAAARAAEEVGGRGEGFQPEAKEETKEGEKKEDECPATFGPIITDTAVPLDKGKFAIQPTFGLGFVTRAFSPGWRRISPGGNFRSFGMDWKFTYGLIDNLEVFVVLPYAYNWATGVTPPGPKGGRAAGFGGLGDVNLTLKYRLVEETETRPTVTALFATDFPTGRFRHLNPGRLGLHHRPQPVQVCQALHLLRQPLVLHVNCFQHLG